MNTPIQSLLPLLAPRGNSSFVFPVGLEAIPPPPPPPLPVNTHLSNYSTYLLRGTKLHFMLAKLLGFTLGNREGIAPKISLLLPKNTFQDYRVALCAICISLLFK